MTSPQPPPGSAALRPVVGRAAIVGLCGGMLVGGVGLLVARPPGPVRQPDCVGLGAQECELIADALPRTSAGCRRCAEGALIALSLALFVLVRPRFFPGSRPARP